MLICIIHQLAKIFPFPDFFSGDPIIPPVNVAGRNTNEILEAGRMGQSFFLGTSAYVKCHPMA
jgi:hypothetical protein